MSEDNQVYFIVEEPIEEAVPIEGERSGRDTGGGWGEPRRSRVDAIRATQKKRVGIRASILKAQMQDMINVVDEVFAQDAQSLDAKNSNGLQLEEITLSVQVNAKGELGILGTGGELGGSGGITLKFVRSKP